MIADAARLAIGTLTRVRVAPPRTVDRRVAAAAMLLAATVGAALGLAVGLAAQLLADHTGAGPLLAGALAVAALTYSTRAIHLDGLADTADALGSGRAAAEALAIARRSDIGPFGAVTLVVVLVIDVIAVAQLLASGLAALGLLIALGNGRLVLALACLRGVPAARTDGLGAAVAGSVPAGAFVAVTTVWGFACAALAALLWGSIDPIRSVVVVVGSVVVVLIVATLVVRLATRRLGGITGDVLGALVEVATMTALVILVVGL